MEPLAFLVMPCNEVGSVFSVSVSPPIRAMPIRATAAPATTLSQAGIFTSIDPSIICFKKVAAFRLLRLK